MSEIILTSRQIDRQSYASIDVVKFIMAMIVVAIHVHPLEYVDNEIIKIGFKIISPCAVPFFFLVTGYFLGKKLIYKTWTDNKLILNKTISKTIKMYVIWSIVYLPLAIWDYVYNEHSFWTDILSYIHGFLLVGDHYNSWILWYLLSAIYGFIFIFFFIRRGTSKKNILLYATVMLLIGHALSAFCAYQGVFPKFLITIQKCLYGTGRLATGVFYISLGLFIAQTFDKKISHIKSIMLIFIGLCISAILLLYLPFFSFLGTIFCSIGIFIATLNVKLRNRNIYQRLRNYSVVIYFTHLWIWTIIYTILYGKKQYGMEIFMYTYVVCLLVSEIWINRKRYW